MKVSGYLRPKGILKGTRKSGGFLKEVHINPSLGRTDTVCTKVYSGQGWSNDGNFWYILGPLTLVEWCE